METHYDAAPPAASRAERALWNPAAAACWSLVFTPAFGAYLHMRNWEALGETAQAARARRWWYASLGLLLLHLFGAALRERLNSDSGLMQVIGALFFLVWYWFAAWPHARAVKVRFGTRYARKSWDYALLGAVAAGTAHASASALAALVLVAVT
jgi:hypothetical protein